MISKNYRFSRHYILGTYNLNLIELILKPVIMYLMSLAADAIYKNKFEK